MLTQELQFHGYCRSYGVFMYAKNVSLIVDSDVCLQSFAPRNYLNPPH